MSTDIDGSPIFILRPDDVGIVLSLFARAQPIMAHEQPLLDKMAKWALKPKQKGPSFDELMRASISSTSQSPPSPPPATPS